MFECAWLFGYAKWQENTKEDEEEGTKVYVYIKIILKDDLLFKNKKQN